MTSAAAAAVLELAALRIRIDAVASDTLAIQHTLDSYRDDPLQAVAAIDAQMRDHAALQEAHFAMQLALEGVGGPARDAKMWIGELERRLARLEVEAESELSELSDSEEESRTRSGVKSRNMAATATKAGPSRIDSKRAATDRTSRMIQSPPSNKIGTTRSGESESESEVEQYTEIRTRSMRKPNTPTTIATTKRPSTDIGIQTSSVKRANTHPTTARNNAKRSIAPKAPTARPLRLPAITNPPSVPPGFPSWAHLYNLPPMRILSAAQVQLPGAVVVPSHPCTRCVRLDVPCLVLAASASKACLVCRTGKQHEACVSGLTAQPHPHADAVAAFHNHTLAMGTRLGLRMGDEPPPANELGKRTARAEDIETERLSTKKKKRRR
ncbi:hypothetical protein MIND_00927000 [Mycena indigotica]|uniref:Uncharacterized protein n=1 Tax=Mycena indigotica TaxID=2126181 RepID=A0A8H6SDW8_9AGAR|nr:uncharacterized protein MIND_00927000 [Mycena indigotica]KAF7296951.1 hypothetical protein MIND_00927000 [Mycena indigotica]